MKELNEKDMEKATGGAGLTTALKGCGNFALNENYPTFFANIGQCKYCKYFIPTGGMGGTCEYQG